MSWCHTCRLEYRDDTAACSECNGGLTTIAAPERRLGATIAQAGFTVVATLPFEQALAASELLDRHGILHALRDVPAAHADAGPVAVDVVVAPALHADAQAILRGGRRARRPAFGTWLFIATAAALFLSSFVVAMRWLMTGSPLPG